MHSKSAKILSFCLFLVLFYVGFLLSQRKLIWGDELLTQEKTIDTHNYKDILTSNFFEGNRSPLFYLIQKATSDMCSFRMPPDICNRKRYIDERSPRRVHNRKSQIIMRIPSNIYMSLGITLIFYFFTRYFSLWTGVYSLLISLISPMVWMYWVETRPYSLCFLLTTIQLFILWRIILIEKPIKREEMALGVVHVLLALTTVVSIFQICIASYLLWRQKYYKKQVIWISVIPVSITLFYYLAMPIFKFRTYYLWANLTDAVMPERLCVYLLYGIMFWKIPKNISFLKTFLLWLTSACFILFTHLYTKNSDFGFYSRYLIYLVPADIMMMSLASQDLFQLAKGKHLLFLINTLILFGGLLLTRGLLTYINILASGIYLHASG